MISILGGKWTTHRLMGEETIDKVQEYLGGPIDSDANPGASAERIRGLPLGLLGDAQSRVPFAGCNGAAPGS